MQQTTLSITVSHKSKYNPEYIADLIKSMIDIGANDAQETISSGEGDLDRAIDAAALVISEPIVPTLPRVLVTVSGGVASYVSDDGVDVEIFDHDNYDEEDEECKKLCVSPHFADLAEQVGVPVQQPNQHNFIAGDKVFAVKEQALATVLDTYKDGRNGSCGDIRLDLSGNTPISSIEPYDASKHSKYDHTFKPIRRQWKIDYKITQDVPVRD